MNASSALQALARDRLFNFPSERVIALGRIVLLLFAIMAVTLESSLTDAPVRAATTTLLVYLAVAVLQVVLAFRQLPSPTEQICSYLFDIAAVATLVALTGGLDSPFIV